MNTKQNTETKTNNSTATIFRGEKNMTDATIFKSTVFGSLARNKLAVSFVALMTAMGAASPAFADISNTVTVTGSDPNGDPLPTPDPDLEDTVDVTVEAPAPDLLISKSYTFTTDTDSDSAGDVGDVVEYTFTVTNNGNMTMTGTSVIDTMDNGAALTIGWQSFTTSGATQGDLPTPTVGDTSVDLAPGTVAVFTASYTITQNDLNTGGGSAINGGDNDIDNSAIARGTHSTVGGGSTTHDSPIPATEEVPLDVNPSLLVAKSATPTTGVGAGDVITYTYTITNDGNVPISNVALTDVFNGSGTFTQPNADSSVAVLTDNLPTLDSTDVSGDTSYDTLAPGDVLTITTTYTVTQSDVDNLQ